MRSNTVFNDRERTPDTMRKSYTGDRCTETVPGVFFHIPEAVGTISLIRER